MYQQPPSKSDENPIRAHDGIIEGDSDEDSLTIDAIEFNKLTNNNLNNY